MQVGQQVGKLLGGLSEAIKSSQKDALANKLMDQQSISQQPGAGQTQDLGTLPSDGSAAQQDPDPDPGTDLNQEAAASSLQSQQPSDFTLNPQDYSSGGGNGSVGSMIHTGGVQEMNLQKEALAEQMKQTQFANAQADAQAKASGTGQYAMEAAIKRAQLAKTQADLAKATAPKPVKEEKNPPAVNIGSEPVIDQNQLNRHIDGIYGNGAAANMASSLNEPAQVPDPTNPNATVANPNAPVMSPDGKTVTVGPANKRITLPVAEAATYTKQANALRIKQGMPAFRVPGEDQTVGATADNPFIAQNNLDVYSRAPGTWIKLPNGKIAQVPPRR